MSPSYLVFQWALVMITIMHPMARKGLSSLSEALIKREFAKSEYRWHMEKSVAVYGIYPSSAATDGAIGELRSYGFSPADVSVLLLSPGIQVANSNSSVVNQNASLPTEPLSSLGESLRWLVGVGAISLPGIGSVIAAGPIMAALASINAGTEVDDTTSVLMALGISLEDSKRYEAMLSSQAVLVSVHTENEELTSSAREILAQTCAEDITEEPESQAYRAGRRWAEERVGLYRERDVE